MKKYFTILSCLFFLSVFCLSAQGQVITTVAGNGGSAYSGDGGQATAAQIGLVHSLAVDNSGCIYFSSVSNQRIRKIDAYGVITTIAGTGTAGFSGDGGPATNAQISSPKGIAVDGSGNVYFCDFDNCRVRKIDVSGNITSIAGNGSTGFGGDGGPATAATIGNPHGIAIDVFGNIYISNATYGYSRIRKVNSSGIITTYAGVGTNGTGSYGGPASASPLNGPSGLAIDGSGNMFVCNYNFHIDKINVLDIIVRFAGTGGWGFSGDGGPATAANMTDCFNVATDFSGNVYIPASYHHRFRRVNSSGIISTFAGTGSAGFSGDGGPATAATFNNPYSVAVGGPAANVYVGDRDNFRIRMIAGNNRPPFFTGGNSQSITVCGNSPGDSINLVLPAFDSDASQKERWSVVALPTHGTAFVSDTTTSTGDTIHPHGCYYTPTISYTGNDSFKIRVTDGYASDTITIYATIISPVDTITGAGHVCAGLTTTWADSTPGGWWSSGATGVATVGSATGLVAGIAAGTAAITYTAPTGCFAIKTITVNPLPAAVTGVTSLCEGSPVTLTSSPGGGVWSSGSVAVATTDSLSGVVTGVTAGTAVITYMLPTGCLAVAMVTVNATPPAIIGAVPVCVGGVATLTIPGGGGAWSSLSPGIATIGSATGLMAGISGGTTVISYTLPTGCFSTTTATVNLLPTTIVGMGSVCTGAATILYSLPGGGAWSSGSAGIATVGSGTGVVAGLTAGIAAMTYTLPTGCAAMTTVTVNPTPPVITGSPMMCIGSTTALSNAMGGGYWGSSDIFTADIDAGTGVVTGVALGTATITYTMPGSGCHTAIGVFVNPAPTSITGISTVCPTATATLFNGVSGGIWSSGATGIATIGSATGIYTGVTAGTTTMTYSMGAGCSATFPITVSTPPVMGAGSVCVGGSATLTATGGSGVWSSGSTGIATVGSATGVVTGVGAGTAPITFTATSTGCTATAVMTVNPTPAAIAGAGSVCVSGSATLTNSASGGTWTSSNTAIVTIGSTTGVMSGIAAGNATISYTLPTGCRSTAIVTVNAPPTAIVGPSTVCIGSSATLTTGSTGGIWTKSNSNVNIGSASGIVTGVSAGVVTTSYVLPTGCYSTKAMTVNTSPGTITGTLGVCVGGTSTLSVGAGSGVWSSSNTAVATVGSATGMVAGMTTGTATITYLVGSGCMATAVVTVNPLPTAWSVTGGGGYCLGGTGLHIGLSGSNIGVSYQLYVGGTPVGSALAGTGGSLDFGFQTTAGTYTITAINTTTGCTRPMTGSAVMVINMPPDPPGGPSAVCVGATGTLTGSPTGGIWTSATPATATIGSTTGIVTGVAIGTTLITYTLSTGCYSTGTMNVTTAPTAISGSSTVCAGDATLLTNGVSGGVWSSSATGIATVGSLTGAVLGVSAGVANITYSLGAGCTVTKLMTVIAAPAPITGSLNVCEAATTALTSATPGGTWTSGSTPTATVGSTGIVTGIAAGTATITYSAGGCNTTATVTVHPIPGAIPGSAQVCVSATTTLTTTGSGGTWSSSSTAIATIGSTTGIVNGITAGTATITYSVGGCMTTRAITVNAIPTVLGAGALCVSATSALSAGSGSGVWSSGSTAIATVGATTGIVTGVAAGTAAITFTPATGCIAIKTVTVNTTPGSIAGAGSVCVSANMTLTNSVGGGVWTSGATGTATIGSSTGIVTGVASGTAPITYSLGSGCTVYANVTVNPLPAPISGTAVFCAGTSVTHTTSTTGGAWTSTNTSTATVGSITGVVNGITAGTATISYTLPTGCAVKKDVTVTPLPSAITGSTQVCMSGTTTLSNPIGGGAWSSSNPVIAAIGSATGIVTGSSIGTATITYSLGPGCTTTIIMTVQPLPAGITGGTNICVGATTTLSSPTAGGTWSTASTNATVGSSTGIVTGTAGGAAIMSYTLPTGCAATHTVSVIAVPAITGLHNMCAWGDTMTIHNIISGGAYSSTWVTVLNLGSGAGRVTAGAPGTATITYMIPAGCSTTATITVNPLPSPITGATDLCIGTTGTLSNATPGGAWSSSNTTTATIVPGTGAVSALAAGITLMRYTLPTGCMVDTLLTVSVPPVAGTISGATAVCIGQTSAMSASAGSGVWTSTNIAIATIGSTTGIVAGVTAGTVTISYTITNACGTAAAGKALTVNPSPNAGTITGADSVCVGSSTTLTMTGGIGGGVWSTTTGRASVSASGTVTGLSVGVDTVRYTVTDGTCTSAAKKPIKVLPNGSCGPTSPPAPLHGWRGEMWRIRPNPASDHIIISAPVEDIGDVTMIIYDMVGRKQMERVLRFTKNEVRVPLELVPGVYIVELRAGGERGVYRVVVE